MTKDARFTIGQLVRRADRPREFDLYEIIKEPYDACGDMYVGFQSLETGKRYFAPVIFCMSVSPLVILAATSE